MTSPETIRRVSRTRLVLPFILFLLPALASTLRQSTVYDISGSKISMMTGTYITTDTNIIEIPFIKKLNTATYIDYPVHIMITDIPGAKVTWNRQYYQNQTYSNMDIMVSLTGGDGIERILPFDIDFFNTFCYSGGIPGADCTNGNNIDQLGLFTVLPTIDASTVYIKVYLGGNTGMSRLRMNTTYGTTAVQYVPQAQLVWPTRIKFTASLSSDSYLDMGSGAGVDDRIRFPHYGSPGAQSISNPWGYYRAGYGSSWNTFSSLGDTGYCGLFYLNGYTPSTGMTIESPVHITLLTTACNLYGMGASTGTSKFEIYPGFYEANIYSGGGTPTSSLYTRCWTGGNTVTDWPHLNWGIGLTATSGTYNLNKNNITYHHNSSLGTYGGCAEYSGISMPLESIYVLSQDQSLWKQDNYFGQLKIASLGGGDAFEGKITVYPASSITSGDTATYWWASYSKQYSSQWGSIDQQIEAYSKEQGTLSYAKTYSQAAPLCGTTTPNYCNTLQYVAPSVYGNITLSGGYAFTGSLRCVTADDIGYYDSCGALHFCSPCTSCSTIDANRFMCDSACYGRLSDPYCSNGSSLATFTCDSYPYLLDDCEGFGCYAGVCADKSSGSKTTFTVASHLGNSTLVPTTILVNGTDPQGVSFSKTCDTGSDSYLSCSLTLPPGYYYVKGNKTGYQTGAERCIGTYTSSPGYSSGCYLKVNQGAPQSLSFSLLANGENENTTQVIINVKDRTEPVPGAYVIFKGQNRTSDENGKTLFTFIASNSSDALTAGKAYYDPVSYSIEYTIGTITERNIQLNAHSSIIRADGIIGSLSHLVNTMTIGTGEIRIPLKMDRPGKVSITREDVVVRACSDWWCENYKPLGLNIFWVLGPQEGVGYDVVVSNGVQTLTAISRQEYDTIFSEGYCSIYLGKDWAYNSAPTAMVGNTNAGLYTLSGLTISNIDNTTVQTLGSIATIPCQYNDTIHYLLFSTKPVSSQDTGVMAMLDHIGAANYALNLTATRTIDNAGNMLNKLVVTPIMEFLIKKKGQDIVTDFIIFNLNTQSVARIVTDKTVYTGKASINGVSLDGTLRDIIASPVYMPLLRNGEDQLILDSGMLGAQLRGDPRDLSAGTYSDLGVPLDSQDWYMEVSKGRTSIVKGVYYYEFRYPTNNLVSDVIYDIQNHRYASADLEYFRKDSEAVVPPMITATRYKIQTYLKVVLMPDDKSPNQVEYYRADIPYDTDTLLFPFLILCMVGFLIVVYPYLNIKRRRGRG